MADYIKIGFEGLFYLSCIKLLPKLRTINIESPCVILQYINFNNLRNLPCLMVKIPWQQQLWKSIYILTLNNFTGRVICLTGFWSLSPWFLLGMVLCLSDVIHCDRFTQLKEYTTSLSLLEESGSQIKGIIAIKSQGFDWNKTASYEY